MVPLREDVSDVLSFSEISLRELDLSVLNRRSSRNETGRPAHFIEPDRAPAVQAESGTDSQGASGLDSRHAIRRRTPAGNSARIPRSVS